MSARSGPSLYRLAPMHIWEAQTDRAALLRGLGAIFAKKNLCTGMSTG